MSIITTGLTPKALWPGVKNWWGQSYEKHEKQHTAIFPMETSDKNYEEDVLLSSFTLAPVKDQAQGIQYDTETQGYVSRYTHVVYGLGFVVTQEELEDVLYPVVQRRTERLAFSMNQTKEIVAANVLNRAFTAGYTGGDGSILCVSTHSTAAGSMSNVPSVTSDLSEASLEDMLVQIAKAQNDRGLFIALKGRKLVIPPNLMFTAERILKSTLQNDTGNNAINAMKSKGMLSEGYTVNNYLTSTSAWFILTNAPRGLVGYQRRPIAITMDNDFDTSNAKYKATERYSFGWTDWRGVYGSAGA